VVPVFTVTEFLVGEYWQALRGLMLHALVSLFFVYLFFNFVYDVWGSHRGVADSGLLGYDSMFLYSLPFYTALYLKRSESCIYVYGIKLFGCLVCLSIIHATLPPTNMNFDEHGFARNALAMLCRVLLLDNNITVSV